MSRDITLEEALATRFRRESQDICDAAELTARVLATARRHPGRSRAARRWVPPVAVATAVLLIAGLTILGIDRGRHTADQAASTTSTSRFTDVGTGLSFDYPTSWRLSDLTDVGKVQPYRAWLSTQPLAEDCGELARPACVFGVHRLDSAGITLAWFDSFPLPHGTPLGPSGLIALSGGAAYLYAEPATGDCLAIGGAIDLRGGVTFLAGASQIHTLEACLGPANQAANIAAVTAMLTSARYAK